METNQSEPELRRQGAKKLPESSMFSLLAKVNRAGVGGGYRKNGIFSASLSQKYSKKKGNDGFLLLL